MVVLALSLCVAIAARSEPRQQGSAPPAAGDGSSGPTISVEVNLVVLHATVRNAAGGFVSGLQEPDFRVYEDGRPQTIRLFRHEDAPVAVGLIVDNSGSMVRKRTDVAVAALAFVRSSNPADQIFIVNFNEHATFGLPDSTPFSADGSELVAALMGVPASGKTALYDAIEAGLDHLKKATYSKKALIVVSDGGDNASAHTLNDVLQDAGRSDAMIYTIGLLDEYDRESNPRALKQVARATGGEAFFPKETKAVIAICRGIAQDIRNQYTIGYAPDNNNLDGGYRRIRVIIAGRRGGHLSVRTREGYIASPRRNPAPAGPARVAGAASQ